MHCSCLLMLHKVVMQCLLMYYIYLTKSHKCQCNTVIFTGIRHHRVSGNSVKHTYFQMYNLMIKKCQNSSLCYRLFYE
uniref:Secreted protein n=1 Tax=Anguilla anguilla TaxID=7936 RepID=A0A0E9Y2T2_ANGAN